MAVNREVVVRIAYLTKQKEKMKYEAARDRALTKLEGITQDLEALGNELQSLGATIPKARTRTVHPK